MVNLIELKVILVRPKNDFDKVGINSSGNSLFLMLERPNFNSNFKEYQVNYKKNVLTLFFVGMCIIFSSSAVLAQDTMKKDDPMMAKDTKEDLRPIVAIISAEWCPYCKKVEPVISGLMKDYSKKLNFIVFDVTDEKTTAEAMKKAESLGLDDFFKKYKGKTSTVAVLKDKEIAYKTSNNGKRGDYEKAFDAALK